MRDVIREVNGFGASQYIWPTVLLTRASVKICGDVCADVREDSVAI